MILVNQPTSAPSRKVTAAGVAAVVVSVAAAIVDVSSTVDLPPQLVALATGVAAVGTAYLVRERA